MIKKTTATLLAIVTALLLVTAYVFNSVRMLDDFDFGDDD